MLANSTIIAFAPTSDPARSRAFYQDILGLRFIKDDGFALVFDAHGSMLRIAKAGPFTPAPFTILGWQTDRIESLVPEMARQGVRFEQFGLPGQNEAGIWSAPGGDQVAWFKDPDGNILSVSQHV
jgi:catechol 2,3-dioxygenase-like lactoylglutathione lyase family enzyme